MLQSSQPVFSRNLGFLSTDEQEILNQSVIAIAGAGGDGGMLALQLARLGVGELRLADPDPFEIENINRQAACTVDTLGKNKAVAVGNYISTINPDIVVKTYTDGITKANVKEFIRGADLVIDETEFTLHNIGVMLARAARQAGVPNMMAMNLGFGATVTSFDPNPRHGRTFEAMLGLSETASLKELATAQPALSRWLPYIPPYADLEVFKKIATGEKSAPSIAPGVAMAAGMAATQAILHLLKGQNNRPQPVTAPKVLMMDAMTGQSRKLTLHRATHYRTLLRMLIRNKLGANPHASY